MHPPDSRRLFRSVRSGQSTSVPHYVNEPCAGFVRLSAQYLTASTAYVRYIIRTNDSDELRLMALSTPQFCASKPNYYTPGLWTASTLPKICGATHPTAPDPPCDLVTRALQHHVETLL